ncbi:MAG: hypothetical protein JW726_08675 [Anaerolineales bacterium]|nr:hypothetical protein [Anaerolineales bacterium]
MSDDFPTQLRYQLRDAAYARLMASEKLGASLASARTSQQQRMILEEIVSNGQKTIEQMGHSGDPYLLANTYLSLTAAYTDLAGLEEAAAKKYSLLREAGEYADLASASAAESKHSIVAIEMLPWLLNVMTRALYQTSGSQNQAMQLRILRVSNQLKAAFKRQQQERTRAAQDLYTAQLLLRGLEAVKKPSERRTVLVQAQKVAQAARTTAVGAGDRDLGGKIQAELEHIQSELRRLAENAV